MSLTLLAVALTLAADPGPRFEVRARVAVREALRPDAEVCLVHLHGNERPARQVMEELLPSTCSNALWLDDARDGGPWQDDRVPLPMTRPTPRNPTGVCLVNPNRVLTPAGRAQRIDRDCDGDPMARAALEQFVDDTLAPALERCRGGARRLPVVALHNHSNMTSGDLDARAVLPPHRPAPHELLLVTRDDDAQRLASLDRFTVVVQSKPPADDGSLSVLMQGERYINVEAHMLPNKLERNRAMAAWALRSVGGWVCGAGDWRTDAADYGAGEGESVR